MTKKKQIVRQSFLIAGSRYIEEFINGIRGFIIAVVLGPDGFGLWHIIKIVYMLGEQSGLGTSHAMVREVAYINGPTLADSALVTRYQQTAFTFGVAITVLAATLGLVAYFQYFDALYPVEAILTAIALLLSFSYFFARTKLQSENQIVQIVKVSLGFVILNFLFGVSLLLLMSLHSISGLLAYRVDSIIVYFMLGAEMTGYYGLAVFIVIIVSSIPISITYVIFPKMMQDMRKKGKKDVAAQYTKRATVAVSSILPLFLGLIFINIEPLLTLAMNEYVDAVSCLHILTIALYFYSLQQLYANALIVMGKQRMAAAIQGIILLVGGLVDVLVILAGYGIEGVAIATALTFYMLFMSTALYTMVAWCDTPKRIKLSLATLHLKFLYLVGLLWFVTWAVGNENASIITSLYQSLLYVLITVPVLIIGVQKEI
jgi:O-antigen/teichoic acid export membrane protein